MSKLTRYFFFRMINPFFTSTNFNTVSNEAPLSRNELQLGF